MRRTLFVLSLGAILGASGFSLASRFQQHGQPTVRKLSERDVVETVNGKTARVTTVEVSLDPGAAGQAHRHPGPVFGYVLEGTFELGLGDEPVKTLKAGDTFYEPGGILHRVSRNPSTTERTRVLAVLLHPRGATQLTTPAAEH